MDSEEEGFQGTYLYELLKGVQFLSCDSISRHGPRKRYNGSCLEGATGEYLTCGFATRRSIKHEHQTIYIVAKCCER